jgi:D-arginine dehydrogenase
MYDRAYGNATVRALTAASHEFFLDPSRLGLGEPLLSPRGALHVARADQAAKLERTFESIRALAPDAQLHDGQFARQKAPILREGLFTRCIWDPSAADIEVSRLHDALLNAVKRNKGELVRHAPVERLERTGAGWVVTAGDKVYEAPIVVDAAGAWADQVAALAGLAPLGLQPRRRSMAVVSLPGTLDPRSWPMTVDLEETWYFKGEAGRLLVSPAEAIEVEPCDASVDDETLAAGIARFEAATTVEVKRVTSSWAGLRSFFRDDSPVLGPDPRAEGFHWYAGLGGFGIQTAPAASALVAATILGQSFDDPALVAATSAARLITRR